MDKPTLKLNLPKGWKLDFAIREDEPSDGDIWTFEQYDITPDESCDITHIHISKMAEAYEIGDPFDNILASAEDYLKDLQVPDSLRPSAMDFVKQSEVSGVDAFYIVFQEVGDPAAELLVVFEAPDRKMVWVNILIKDWADGFGETSAIDSLSRLIVF